MIAKYIEKKVGGGIQTCLTLLSMVIGSKSKAAEVNTCHDGVAWACWQIEVDIQIYQELSIEQSYWQSVLRAFVKSTKIW